MKSSCIAWSERHGDLHPTLLPLIPHHPGNDFSAIAREHPLVAIFLPAFDHPVTREYLTRHLQTLPRLRGVRLACVVRSSPRMVAKATQGEVPFTLICDAPGCCYGYLGVGTGPRHLRLELCGPAHLQRRPKSRATATADQCSIAAAADAGGGLHGESCLPTPAAARPTCRRTAPSSRITREVVRHHGRGSAACTPPLLRPRRSPCRIW